MEHTALIKLINEELAIELNEQSSYAALHAQLAAHLNDLIKHDFEKLISYLYRIDVSEQKLRSMLQQNPGEDAANMIAALIIERQQQKIETRRKYRQRNDDVDEEEKW